MKDYELRLTVIAEKKYPIPDGNKFCVSKLQNLMYMRRMEYSRLYNLLSKEENKEEKILEWEKHPEGNPERNSC